MTQSVGEERNSTLAIIKPHVSTARCGVFSWLGEEEPSLVRHAVTGDWAISASDVAQMEGEFMEGQIPRET